MSSQLQLTTSNASRTLFNVAIFVPVVGLTMLLLTVIFAKLQRSGIFITFILSNLLLAVSGTLLPLAGDQSRVRPRNTALCMTQTAIMDGTVTMSPVASLILVLQLAAKLYHRSHSTKGTMQLRLSHAIALIISPFIILFTFVIVDVLWFVRILRDGPLSAGADNLNPAFYCKLVNIYPPVVPLPAVEMPIVVFIIVVSLLTLGLECWIGYALWRYRQYLKMTNQQSDELPLASLIRLTLFTLYRLAIVIIALQVVRDPVRMFPVAEFAHGAIPLVVFFIFGTQKDVWATWLQWFESLPTLLCGRGRT